MISELGHFALTLALGLALVQATVPLIGAYRGDVAWMRVALPTANGQFVLILTAFVALTYAFVVSDFSVQLVVMNSHTAKPLLYKITGVWGNHEGSMLLWVLILSFFGSMVARFGTNLPAALRARVLGIQGLVGVAFLLFILVTSNPFIRLDPAPLNGRDLNPLLQDIGLALHPPFLYLGYVGFSVAFSFAIAALLEGRVTAAWARWVRPWTLLAWSSLTIGIAIGSYWAYYELGWGGYWFWDPVENASLMPWIAGTALLHSTVVTEKRGALKSWTLLLAILTFSLSLLGTFLVRSGILTSVHTFANDPARGFFVLVILFIVVGASLVLYAWRAPTLKTESFFAPISREGGLVLNNLLLTVTVATVFIGTLYPLFLNVIGGAQLSVGAPYFNLTFGPLMGILAVFVPLGPLLSWKRGDLLAVMQRLWWAGLAAFAAFILTLIVVFNDGPYLASLGMALATWLIFGALAELALRLKIFREPWRRVWLRARHLPRSAYGTTLAHAGLGIVVAGLTGITAWQSEHISAMRPGERVTLAGYEFVFVGVDSFIGPNYRGDRATLDVYRDKKFVTRLQPEKRVYPVTQMPTTEAAIKTQWWGDIYAVLGDRQGPEGDDIWAVRLYHKPFVIYIWLGALVMAGGGLVSLFDKRLRVGVPAPRRAKASAPAVPAE